MSDLAKAMGLLTYIGAANWDSTDEQRVRLRAKIEPLLDQFRDNGKMRPLFDAVTEVMGDEWRPTGDWARQLEAVGWSELL